MNSIDKMLGNIISKKKITNKIINNFRLKQFGGKNDLDGDGVPNRLDCQPRNVMRQDTIKGINLKEIKITKGDFEIYERIRASGVTNMFMIATVENLSGLSKEKIIKIMKTYGELEKRFPNVRK